MVLCEVMYFDQVNLGSCLEVLQVDQVNWGSCLEVLQKHGLQCCYTPTRHSREPWSIQFESSSEVIAVLICLPGSCFLF